MRAKFIFQLIDPMPIMIWVACIVEFSLGNTLDGAILFFINMANASLSFYEGNCSTFFSVFVVPFALQCIL